MLVELTGERYIRQEMMFAAIIAAAFVVSSPVELVQIGLSEIPEHCKLAESAERH